jgi:hypothetical protein
MQSSSVERPTAAAAAGQQRRRQTYLVCAHPESGKRPIGLRLGKREILLLPPATFMAGQNMNGRKDNSSGYLCFA